MRTAEEIRAAISRLLLISDIVTSVDQNNPEVDLAILVVDALRWVLAEDSALEYFIVMTEEIHRRVKAINN